MAEVGIFLVYHVSQFPAEQRLMRKNISDVTREVCPGMRDASEEASRGSAIFKVAKRPLPSTKSITTAVAESRDTLTAHRGTAVLR